MHIPLIRLGDRYRLEERIGAGGMGEVWRATDEVLGRTVAVKVVLPALLTDPTFVRRFLAEARAMASVRHPGVVTIHDYFGNAEGAYLVMEYVEGEPLSRTLDRLGRLAPATAMELVAQAADALQAAHDRGIVHRDVKPGNLLMRTDGTVALTDFGIALAQEGTALTTAGAILGTPSYLAPEQVLGEPATARSDVYALGVVAYECLTGRRPFTGENPFAIAMRRVREAPPPLGPGVPAPMAAVVERALAVDPAHRWSTAADLATAARGAVAGLPPGRVRPAPSESRRRLALIGLAIVVALTGAVVIAQPWRSTGSTSPNAVTTSGGGTTRGAVPAGLRTCTGGYCPSVPACWDRLNTTGGVAQPLRAIDCAKPHRFETFVIGYLPADALSARQDALLERPDIGGLCSEAAMAAHSRDPGRTTGWFREPWPVQVEGTWLLYCLGGDTVDDTTGAVFGANP
jgi:serine/threonine-protein kinase